MSKENDDQLKELKEKLARLEIENKHLKNELQLTKAEKEAARKDYFDIVAHMEEKVMQRTTELRELREISLQKSKELQTILDWTNAMIFYKDMEQKYVRVNQEFSNALGIPINKIIGKTLHQIFPELTNAFLEDDLEVIRKGEPLLNISSTIQTTRGERHILANKIPYKDIDGNVIGIIGLALDVSGQVSAEHEKHILEEKLAQLEKMDAIGRLAGGVAHDLNNVLSAVVSYPDYILPQLPPDSNLRRPVETILKSGKKAAAIVEDLLTLARRGVSVNEGVNLNNIVKAYLESPEYTRLRAFHPQVKISVCLDEELFNVKGSPIHLTKTVMNLVANAVEATEEKGTVTITTANRYLDRPMKSYDLSIPEGDYVVLTIQDTGVGIQPENLKKIFEPFYTKKIMGRSGTGLGMAVVWGTVKDHKGNINIISQKTVGTTFEIFLPISREELPVESDKIPLQSYMGQGETILVVDDVPEQREISAMLLSSLEYKVITVSSGEEALAYLKNNAVDLVVLDMIMDPGIDGLTTYRRMLHLSPGQRAVITSGYSETDRVRKAQQLGAGAYIKKPYTRERLGLAIREELEK